MSTKKATRTPAIPAEGEESVTLLSDHTDAGIKHEAGETIVVSAVTAEWLRGQGVVAKQAATQPSEE